MTARNQAIHTLFKDASKDVHNLKNKPTDGELLELYANYKQGTVGDINTDKPSFYMFKDVAKWSAWNNLKGLSKLQAQVNYIKIVEELKSQYS
jgi:diazepam-binding inhibitor (GABA receptor modulating acyl-CoA-binding protein)